MGRRLYEERLYEERRLYEITLIDGREFSVWAFPYAPICRIETPDDESSFCSDWYIASKQWHCDQLIQACGYSYYPDWMNYNDPEKTFDYSEFTCLSNSREGENMMTVHRTAIGDTVRYTGRVNHARGYGVHADAYCVVDSVGNLIECGWL